MTNGRCKLHGGASLAGPAHPNFRHGRHSRFMPNNLADQYNASVNDPQLVQMRDELALIDLRVDELYSSIGQTGNAKALRGIRGKLSEFKTAGSRGGKGAVGAARLALQQLEDLIDAACTTAATWEELRDTIDLRRRLSESETRRLKDMHQTITAERALALMALLVQRVKEHVTDPQALTAISAEYRRLVGGSSGKPVAAGSGDDSGGADG